MQCQKLGSRIVLEEERPCSAFSHLSRYLMTYVVRYGCYEVRYLQFSHRSGRLALSGWLKTHSVLAVTSDLGS